MVDKRSIKSVVGLIITFCCLMFLTGCSIIKPSLSNKQLTNEFSKTTQSLLIARGTVAKQVIGKKAKNGDVKLKTTDKKVLVQQKAKVNQSLKKVSASAGLAANYPKALQKYENSILTYISLLQQGTSIREARSQFHKIVVTGQRINIQYQNMRQNRYLNIASFADNTSGYKSDSPLSITPTNKKSKQKDTTTVKKPKSQNTLKDGTKVKTVHGAFSLSIGWGIYFIFLVVIIISSIFLQPNRSNDSMNALTESGGATLFNRPRPRGYELFLLRSTEISVLILVASLIIYNRMG
ncbi:preprotein translocase subunit SecG [Lactobacillus crispatus]|uniref:preprotein translocase subunit SecG n=1 Tax=Lactobacillus crispatus TaxID=47770 RepID=UPI000E0758B7|nr:preprotein translocase subunit SecG [Lactobacillus acidophilus]